MGNPETIVRAVGDGVRFWIHVSPGARRGDAVGPMHGDALRVFVAAPAVDGKANAAVTGLLARLLGVAGSAVRIERGLTARRKQVHVSGVHEADVRARLGLSARP